MPGALKFDEIGGTEVLRICESTPLQPKSGSVIEDMKLLFILYGDDEIPSFEGDSQS